MTRYTGAPLDLEEVRRRLQAGRYDLDGALEAAYVLGWDNRTVDLVMRLGLTPRYQPPAARPKT